MKKSNDWKLAKEQKNEKKMKLEKYVTIALCILLGTIIAFNFQKHTGEEIKEMKVGESAYTAPWAVKKQNGKFYVNESYPTHSSAFGTIQMLVIKKEDGYHVRLPRKENKKFRWTSEGYEAAEEKAPMQWAEIPVQSLKPMSKNSFF